MTEYCPRCGNQRTGSFRFCRSCQFDFDTAARPSLAPAANAASVLPPVPPLATQGPTASLPAGPTTVDLKNNGGAVAGGIAWVISGVLIGYLALLQFGSAGQLRSFGLSDQGLSVTAIWNGLSAALTLFFAARLLSGPTRGILGTSAGWALLDVGWGVYQIANGVSNEAFIGATVAAGAAGVLSLAARNVIIERERMGGGPTPGQTKTLFDGPILQNPFVLPSKAADREAATVATRASGRPVLIIAGMLVLAIVAGFVVVNAQKPSSNGSPSTGTTAGTSYPYAGEIWFGTTYDPATLEISGRSSSFSAKQQVAMVASLSRPSKGEILQVYLTSTFTGDLNVASGTIAANNDVISQLLPGYWFGEAGSYRVTVRDSGGNVLAQSTLQIQ